MVKKPLRPYFWGGLGSGGVGGPAMTKACHPQADAKNYRPIPPNSIVTILRRVGGWDRQFLTSKAKTGFHPGESSSQLPTHQAIWKMVCQNTTTNYHYQPTTNIFINQLPTTKYLLACSSCFFWGGNVHNDWQIHRGWFLLFFRFLLSRCRKINGLRPSIDEKVQILC